MVRPSWVRVNVSRWGIQTRSVGFRRDRFAKLNALLSLQPRRARFSNSGPSVYLEVKIAPRAFGIMQSSLQPIGGKQIRESDAFRHKKKPKSGLRLLMEGLWAGR